MQPFGEAIHDSTIRHQVHLERFKTSTVREVIRLLNNTQDDIITQIRRMEDNRSRRRLESVLTQIRKINERAEREMLKRMGEEVEAFAAAEQRFVTRSLNAALPGEVAAAIQFVAPADAMLYVAAEQPQLERLVRGRSLRDWFAGIQQGDSARMQEAIRTGWLEGESVERLVRRVRGTRALRFADGTREVTRRHVQALVRTTVQAAAVEAREEVYRENSPVIKKVRYVATLDGRTTLICKSRDLI
jgi:hypothetical protein